MRSAARKKRPGNRRSWWLVSLLSSDRRRLRACRPSLFAVALAAALVAGCFGNGDDGSDQAADSTTTTTRPDVEFVVARSEQVSPHQHLAGLGDPIRGQATEVVERFLDSTSAQPLVTGRAGTDLVDFMTPDAARRAQENDRDAVFDVGHGRVSNLAIDVAEVELTALVNADSTVGLVVADFNWTVTGLGGDRVERRGELSMVPREGAWLIAAYRIEVTRSLGGLETGATTTMRPTS